MGRTLAYLNCIIVLAMILALGKSASAQEAPADKTVVVVIDAGDTDLLVESLVRSTAEAELRKQGYALVENAEVGGDTPQKLLACAGNPACSVTTLAGIEARYVIFISLRPDEGGTSNNFKIVARNYEVATGTALARAMRRCAACKEDVDLANFSEGVIIDLIHEPKPKPKPQVPVTPPTPAPVATGSSAPAPKPVVVRTTTTRSESGGSGLVTALKYTTLIGGIAGLASGTVLVLVDGPVVTDGVRQKNANDTLMAGYGSLAAGAVMLGLSAWLFAVDSDDAPRTHASLVPNSSAGGSLILSGSF